MTETNDPLGHQVVSAKEVVKVHSKKKKKNIRKQWKENLNG